MAKKAKYKVVYVKWVDSGSPTGWTKLHSFKPGICYCESIGYLFHEDETAITLAGHLSWSEMPVGSDEEPDHGDGFISIPRVAVLAMVHIPIALDWPPD
jgi:hypothetical protein